MKVIVIDDEKNSRELLNTLLDKYCPSVLDITLAASVEEARSTIKASQPDLIFLDIEMPNANGFELLDTINDAEILTCFTTGYAEYAIKAIKYNAFGYLLKPIDLEELKEIIIKAEKALKTKKIKEPSIVLTEGGIYNAVKHADIQYIEGSGNYCTIHLVSGKSLLSQHNLTHYEAELPIESFFRVHRSYIVNIAKITSITEGRTGKAVINVDIDIPIANRRMKQFIQAFKTFH